MFGITDALSSVKQHVSTVAALGIETGISLGVMPVFIRNLPPTVYSTIVFVIGGGVGFVATHLTRRIVKTNRVTFLASMKEEKVRGAIYMSLLSVVALVAMLLKF
jgi:nickel-dependent lactate racemase